MAEATLDDVIGRLKDEGHLTRNTGTNSLKSLKQVNIEVGKGIQSKFAEFIEFMSVDKLKRQEDANEDASFRQKMLDAIEEGNDLKRKENERDKADSSGVVKFGALASIAAVSLGTLAGVIGGSAAAMLQLTKHLALLGKAITKFSAILLPSKWTEKFNNLFKNLKLKLPTLEGIKTSFNAGIAAFKGKINGLFKGVLQSWADFKKWMTSGKSMGLKPGPLKTLIVDLTKAFKPIIDSFKGAAAAIKGASKGAGIIAKTLGGIGGLFKAFGIKVGKIATFIGKIFAPIAWVIGIFESIDAMLEAKKKDKSWIKIIEAGIDALVKSLVTFPLDLLKDVVSWALEKMGFEEASKWLDKWSFQDVWNGLTDWFFDTMDAVWKYVAYLFSEDSIGEKIDKVMNDLGDFFKPIKDFFKEMYDKIVEFFKWENIFSKLSPGLQKAFDFVGMAPEGYEPLEVPVQSMDKVADNPKMEELRRARMAADEFGDMDQAPIIINNNNVNNSNTTGGPPNKNFVIPMESNPNPRGPNWDSLSTQN